MSHVPIEVAGVLIMGYDDVIIELNEVTLNVFSAKLVGEAAFFDEDGRESLLGGPILTYEADKHANDLLPMFRSAAAAGALTFDADRQEIRIELVYARPWEIGTIDRMHSGNDPRNTSTDPCEIGTRRLEAWNRHERRPVVITDDGLATDFMDVLEDEIFDALTYNDPSDVRWIIGA